MHEASRLAEENVKLRALLALIYSGPSNLYTDDGEVQDNTALPTIDFKRDTVEAIAFKIQQRRNHEQPAQAGSD